MRILDAPAPSRRSSSRGWQPDGRDPPSVPFFLGALEDAATHHDRAARVERYQKWAFLLILLVVAAVTVWFLPRSWFPATLAIVLGVRLTVLAIASSVIVILKKQVTRCAQREQAEANSAARLRLAKATAAGGDSMNEVIVRAHLQELSLVVTQTDLHGSRSELQESEGPSLDRIKPVAGGKL